MSALRFEVEAALAAGRPERAWDLAAAAFGGDSASEVSYARRLLLALQVPEAAWTAARQSLARQAEIPRQPEPEAIGRVVFPAVDARGEGRFVTARATLDAQDSPGFEAPLDAARRALERPELRFRVSFDANDWTGDSAGLAVGLAACSAAQSRALSPMLAATGALDADGRVRPVGRVPEKLHLRREARPRCRLLCPQDDRADHPALVPVERLRDALDAAGFHAAVDLQEGMDRIRSLDRDGDWLNAARAAAALVEHPELTDEERLELWVLLLTAANHGADAASQAELAPRLDALLTTVDPGNLTVMARAIGSRAVQRIDALDPDGAAETLALAAGRAWPAGARVYLGGPRALLATLRGDHAAALALREQNLRDAPPDEKPRCLGDLSDALLRIGRLYEALDAAEQALAQAEQLKRRLGYQQQTSRYLRLHRARALAALGRGDEALAALAPLEHAPGLDPRLRAVLLRAEITGDRADLPRIGAVLPSALIDRTLARLGDADAAARLLALPPFRGLTPGEAARRLPY